MHLQRNATAYVPKVDIWKGVTADIRSIFNTATREEADCLLAKTIEKFQKRSAA